jgi:hypothetical protein
MAVGTDLERFAKLADLAENVVRLVREFGFLVMPKPRGRPAAKAAAAETPTTRRRGRPRKAVVVAPALPAVDGTDDSNTGIDEEEV